jgi:hypothetical protein
MYNWKFSTDNYKDFIQKTDSIANIATNIIENNYVTETGEDNSKWRPIDN